MSSDGDQDEQYERPTPRLREIPWRQLGPDEAPEEQEDESYVVPDQWHQIHPDWMPHLGGGWASEQDTELRRQEWHAQASAPGPETETQPMPPRQVGLYELIE